MTADESPRLYSRPSIAPVDTVAPQHQLIHADLERWGRWNTERVRPRTCASKERDFDGRAGYRSNHYPTLPVSLPENARNLQIERAVVRMPMQHRTMVTMYYAERRAPVPICRAVAVPWRDFGRWMFDCRAMVLNLLRFQDA